MKQITGLLIVLFLFASHATAGPPPGKAVLNSPSGVVPTSTPTYSWYAVPESSWYCLWVNINGSPKIQAWYSAEQAGCTYGTGTCSIKSSTALVPGSGQWWIQTWNGSGIGQWSNAMSFTYTPNSSKEQARKLLGFWAFKSDITDDNYMLTSIAEDPNKPGDWIAKGEGDYGQPVTAYWSESMKLYALLEPHTSSNDYLLTFEFIAQHLVSGCWYSVDKTGKLGTCYKLTGARSCVPPTEPSLSFEDHLRLTMQAVADVRAISNEPDVSADPRLIEMLEFLRVRTQFPSR